MTRVLTPAELAALTPQAAHDMASTVLESAVYWARIATGSDRAVVDTFGRDVFADPQIGDRFIHMGDPMDRKPPTLMFVTGDGDTPALVQFNVGSIARSVLKGWLRQERFMFAIGVAPAMVAGVGTP